MTLAVVIVAASQAIYMLANSPLCKVSKQKVDGSFLATLLETIGVVFLVVTWSSVTEGKCTHTCVTPLVLTHVPQNPGETKDITDFVLDYVSFACLLFPTCWNEEISPPTTECGA